MAAMTRPATASNAPRQIGAALGEPGIQASVESVEAAVEHSRGHVVAVLRSLADVLEPLAQLPAGGGHAGGGLEGGGDAHLPCELVGGVDRHPRCEAEATQSTTTPSGGVRLRLLKKR